MTEVKAVDKFIVITLAKGIKPYLCFKQLQAAGN